MSGELYLCMYVREFPAQALLRMRPELRARAVAVMEGEPPFQQVCSFNKYARKLGVELGMGRAEMDSFPSVVLLARSRLEEMAARLALLESAGSFSPRVEVLDSEPDFSCVLDIAGTEKLFGPPQRLAIRVQQTFATIGVTCSIAVSANFHSAVRMARGIGSGNQIIVISEGDERRALAHLPLSVLDLSADYAEIFAQWGVSTLGTLAMLPEKDLIARLGQEGKRLRLLARGEAQHLFLPVEPALALEECIELDSPVDVLDSLLFGVSLMLEQLISRAKSRILSLAVVTAELGLEGGGLHTRVVRPAIPTNEKQLWLKLLHLDWIAHPPEAAVVSLRLKVETGNTGKVQLGLFSPQLPEPGRLDVTLARIRALVGEGRVGSVELKDTHHPDAFRLKPFSVAPSSIEREDPLESTFPAASMRRLRPPEYVTMTIRNNRPHSFYFRGVGYEAETSYGPWRAAGDWWSESLWSVEGWDIIAHAGETTVPNRVGGLLCCCMTRDLISGRWQIEALYD
jgi:protein ImuB